MKALEKVYFFFPQERNNFVYNFSPWQDFNTYCKETVLFALHYVFQLAS